jgi:hypothetical protein|tara:strand:+ start:11095 stop:11247 length:153 start_codon:yes stop_codon:yes gene_type:complete
MNKDVSMDKDNVIPFPQLPEEDKQFLEIERQAEQIKLQQERIAKLLEGDT